jgi:hypothetical protein
LLIKSVKTKSRPTSHIYAVEGTNGNDKGFTNLINLMGKEGLKFFKTTKKGENFGPDGLIGSEDVVILKINSQWDERGGTNTDLIKSVISSIWGHPDGFTGEVIIADNGQAQYGSTGYGGSLEYENNNAVNTTQSMKSVAQSFVNKVNVSTYLWDKITEKVVGEYSDGNQEDGYVLHTSVNTSTNVLVSYPKFTSDYGTKISFRRGVWDPDKKEYDYDRLKILNIPVLKCHFIFGVTGAMKHYMGVPSDILTARFGYRTHPTVGRGGMGTLMANTRVPTLNILDAIFVNAKPGTGPNTPYSNAINARIVAASKDPVALDYWASKNILCVLAKKQYDADVSSINPDNNTKGSFGSWLKLAAAELYASGIKVTYDEADFEVSVEELI